MYKMIAIYKMPAEMESFEKHYEEIHAPLVDKIPGIKELRVNRITGGPMGKSDLHMIAEMVFTDKESYKTALRSEENMAVGKDAFSFAKEIISVHFAEETVKSY